MSIDFIDTLKKGNIQLNMIENSNQHSLPIGDNDEILISYQDCNQENINSSSLSNQMNFLSQSGRMNDLELEFQNLRSDKRIEQNRQQDNVNTFTFVSPLNLTKTFSQESEKVIHNNNQNNHRSSLFKNTQVINHINSKMQENNNTFRQNEGNQKSMVEIQTDNNSLLIQSINLFNFEKKTDEIGGFLNTSQKQDLQNKTSTFILPNDKSLMYSSNKSINKTNQENQLSDPNNDSQNSKPQQENRKKADSMNCSAFKSQKTTFVSTMAVQMTKESTKASVAKRLEFHIQKFIYLLKNQRVKRSSENLTKFQRKLINDYSDFTDSFFSYKSYNVYILDLFLHKVSKLISNTSKKCILLPNDTFKIIWDTIQIIFNFVFLFAYSIFLIFGEMEEEIKLLNPFYDLFTVFLFFDIIINFNSSYYLKDQIITKRANIFENYLKSYFFLDFVCLIQSLYICFYSSKSVVYNPSHDFIIYLINLVTFFRIFGVYSKRKVFDNMQQLSNSQRHFIRLINQIIFMISIAHIMGIFWYSLGLYQSLHEIEVVWYTKYDKSTISCFSKYIYSFYWAVTTMITVGYGDITPSNSIECLFCALSMILFSCVFAYSINNIGMILEEIEKSSKEMNDNIIVMQRYLIKRNVNVSLRNRIKQYLHFLGQETKDKNKKAEDQVIGILSNKLRSELTQEVNTKMLKTCSIFYKLFSQQTLQKLVTYIKEIQVLPNEVIFNVGEVGNQAIYFILDGEIEIYGEHEKRKTVYNVLGANRYFGEYSFFTGFSRIFSARSLNLSTLFYLPREEFLNIIKSHSEDMQRYKMLQEQYCANNIISGINAQGCVSCGSPNHFANKCNQTHLVLDSQFIALKNNYFEFQSRNEKVHRRKRKYELSFPLQMILFHFKILILFSLFPRLYIKKNKEYSQILVEKMAEFGGNIYDRVKMYSIQEINTSDEDQENDQEEEYSSDGSTSIDMDSCLNNQQTKEIQAKSMQFNESSPLVNLDSSKLKINLKQEKSNRSTGNGNGGHIPQFLQDPPVESEYTKQTLKSNEWGNSSYDEVPSLTMLEKKLNQEEKFISFAHNQTGSSQADIRNSPQNTMKQNEDEKKLTKISLEIDPPSTLIALIDNEEQQQNVGKPTKQLFLQSLLKEQAQDTQAGEQDNIMKLKKRTKTKSREFGGGQSMTMKIDSNKKIETNIKSNNSQELIDYNDMAKLLARRNCTSKRKQGDDDQKNEKLKQQCSLRKLVTKLQTSSTVYDEIPKDYIEQKIKIDTDNLYSEKTLSTEHKRKQIRSNQLIQLFMQTRDSSNYPSDKNLMELILDILSKKNMGHQKTIIMNSNSLENFDKMQIFSKFFPHNNVDKVLSRLKQKKSQQKQVQKTSQRQNNRRQNIYQDDLATIQKELQKINLTSISGCNFDFENNKSYKPTVLSYGICTKRTRLYPKRIKNENFN